jgi:hypothetical protein
MSEKTVVKLNWDPIPTLPLCTSFTLVIRRSANTTTHLQVASSSRGNPNESICEQGPQCPLNKWPNVELSEQMARSFSVKNPFYCLLFFNHEIRLVCKIQDIVVRYSNFPLTVNWPTIWYVPQVSRLRKYHHNWVAVDSDTHEPFLNTKKILDQCQFVVMRRDIHNRFFTFLHSSLSHIVNGVPTMIPFVIEFKIISYLACVCVLCWWVGVQHQTGFLGSQNRVQCFEMSKNVEISFPWRKWKLELELSPNGWMSFGSFSLVFHASLH